MSLGFLKREMLRASHGQQPSRIEALLFVVTGEEQVTRKNERTWCHGCSRNISKFTAPFTVQAPCIVALPCPTHGRARLWLFRWLVVHTDTMLALPLSVGTANIASCLTLRDTCLSPSEDIVACGQPTSKITFLALGIRCCLRATGSERELRPILVFHGSDS
jgi:hypothetical protein